MITEDYVSYEIAKLLKEKGFYQDFFNEITPVWKLNGNKEELAFYGDDNYPCEWEEWYSAPTLHMACKWLREKGVYMSIDTVISSNGNIYFNIDTYSEESGWNHPVNFYDSYEEAVEAACLYVLKNLI